MQYIYETVKIAFKMSYNNLFKNQIFIQKSWTLANKNSVIFCANIWYMIFI